MKYLGHQGDVKFYQVEDFPEGSRIEDKQTKLGILAYGEATGHAHQIIEEDLPKVDFFKVKNGDQETLCLYVKSRVQIDHGKARDFEGEEADKDYHNPGFLEPGKYVAGIVQQFDPFAKVNEKVVD